MDAFAEPRPEDEARPIGPDLAVTLTGHTAGFVAAELAAGRYSGADAVVAQALSLLQGEDEAAHFRSGYTLELIRHGLDEADRGEVFEVADLDAYFDQLKTEVEAEFK